VRVANRQGMFVQIRAIFALKEWWRFGLEQAMKTSSLVETIGTIFERLRTNLNTTTKSGTQ
jgi:hypothetical protein